MQLINRLRAESQRLRQSGVADTTESSEKQQETMSTLARLEKMRQEADDVARRRSGG